MFREVHHFHGALITDTKTFQDDTNIEQVQHFESISNSLNTSNA